MSKKKITLAEAKEILKTEKVFFNGKDKFNLLDGGKYGSGSTIVFSQEWNIDEHGKPECPFRLMESEELTDGMNLEFNGAVSFLLGKYHLSKNGNPVFEITKPTESKEIFICVDWGGAFNPTRGQSSYYAKDANALYYKRSTSNGGGTGFDYWILPVDYAKDMEKRDVSKILQKIEDDENARVAKMDVDRERLILQKQKNEELKTKCLNEVEPIIQEIKKIEPDFQYKAKDTYLEYNSYRYANIKIRYGQDFKNQMADVLEGIKQKIKDKEIYLPKFRSFSDTLNVYGLKMDCDEDCVTINFTDREYRDFSSYKYDRQGFEEFVNDVTNYKNRIERQQNATDEKARKLIRDAEFKEQKEKAKAAGYPEVFEFHNRLGGATGLSHAYVIEKDGSIREPDYNRVVNENHKYKDSNWLNTADGPQGYNQIVPGEVIVSFKKEITATPYVFNVEWADSEVNDRQLDVICNKLNGKLSFTVDENGNKIKDLKKWAIESVKAKSIECNKKLSPKEKSREEELAKEIMNLRDSKLSEKDKFEKAKELLEEYEKQVKFKTTKELESTIRNEVEREYDEEY